MAPARPNTCINNNNNNNNNENTDHNAVNSNSNNNNNSHSISNNTTNSIKPASVTGAVPKTTTTAKRLATLIKQQMQQQQLQQQQERKNTEIVQPLQRELKSLNDFLLASVNRSRLIGTQQTPEEQIGSTCTPPRVNYDTVGNPQEQPRSFRVRPVQRVRHQQEPVARTTSCRVQQTPSQLANEHNNCNANNTNFISNATIGVVIPTTPNSTAINGNAANNNTVQQTSSNLANQNNETLVAASRRSVFNAAGIPTVINDILNAPVIDINTLRQQFELVRSILGLDENWNTNHEQIVCNGTAANRQRVETTATALEANNMVHEINPNGNDVVVNSSSLEDVAASETSDNRAQSIQSLHSILDTPTPDSSPSFEELQERLDLSSRNMQNLQDKQSQLLRLQNAAKEHLSEMEHLRAQTQKLSFTPGTSQANGNSGGGGGDGPNYESIAEVQSDMATLVGRMKNLTAFIHNQNELSDLLGDDGPEILAEQEALQQKLESLRTQRDDMRELVNELQSINRTAEQSVKERADTANSVEAPKVEHSQRNAVQETPVVSEADRLTKARVVPIEIQRKASSAAERAVAAQAMIVQKNNDIDVLKAQMQRLKDMLSTVNLIEESSAVKDRESGQSQLRSSVSSERERTPVAGEEQHDENIARKVRALNKVTADLRAEAASLEQERDRIHALKAEIQRRKEQAAAAAQMGDDALKRNSLTPTPTPSSQQAYNLAEQQQERDQLKSQYELKKRQFENLCKQLENECVDENTPNNGNQNRRGETLSEADDEADDTNDSDFANTNKFFGNQQAANSANLRRQLSTSTVVENEAAPKTTASQQQQQQYHRQQHHHHHHRHQQQQQNQMANDDESNTAMPNSTIDGASLDAASMQSSSARSYFMPPPMAPVGASWSVPPPAPMPATWSTNYLYSVPHMQLPPNQAASTAPNSMANDYVPTLISGTAPVSSNTSTAPPQVTADPMVLQQIVQTQQMIINSICQTNQTLWHQQREIDSINSLYNTLQDRVNNIAGTADISFSLRSESVPPSAIGANIPNNNHYLPGNRAQSEQPLQFGVNSSGFANFQQQQHIFQQRLQQQQRAGSVIYNYAADVSQQHNSNAVNSVYHAALNNAAVQSNVTNAAPPPPPASQQHTQPTHFNNETPMSPHMPNSPGPIFMHHHNNTIHQNNANLRTQNQHANNLQQQQQQQQAQAAAAVNQPTLNNQVPPGNRANNYWDNFRSYSRQNLLSINSSKSNEDQQQMLQDQQQLRHYSAPRLTAFGSSTNQTRPLMQQQRHLYEVPTGRHNLNSLTTTMSNNLNCNINNNKYMNVMAQQQQQQQQHRQQPQQQQQQSSRQIYHPNVGLPNLRLLRDEFYANIERHDDDEIVDDGNGTLYRSCTPTAAAESNGHNMNLNYGNSPLFQRNKVPAKSSSSATLTQPTPRRSYAAATPPFDDLTAAELHEASYTRPTAQRRVRVVHRDAPDYSEPFELLDDHHDYNIHEPYAPRQANAAAMRMTSNDDNVEHNCDADEASEEINRNLLVNALKNDKFTTKFYESIKEDVFRRLESLFEQHEVENSNRQQHLQQRSQQQQLQQQQAQSLPQETHQATNQVFNDVGAQRDPFRKLYLNQQQQQQQHHNQQQHQQQQEQEVVSSSMLLNVELDEPQMPEEDASNAETESNKGDAETPLDIMQQQNDDDIIEQNEEPEDDVSMQDEPQRLDISSVDQTKNMTSYGNADKHENESNAAGACSLPQPMQKQQAVENDEKLIVTVSLDCQSPPPEFEVIPDYELIEYIIKRIRNQTHSNTVINDPLLVEVSKLTANAAQNSATTKLAGNASTTPIISPKRIYAKIKKSIMSIPRNRDEFLAWYREYLEGMFLVEQHVPVCCKPPKNIKEKLNLTTKASMAANTGVLGCAAATAASVFGSNENRLPLTNGRVSLRDQEDDADLAEADQNSAGNSTIDETTLEASSVGLLLKFESDEFENNENPEEEGGITEGACALPPANNNNNSPNDKASSA